MISWNTLIQQINVFFLHFWEERGFFLKYCSVCMCAQEVVRERESSCQQTDLTAVGLLIILKDLTVNQHRWPEHGGGLRETRTETDRSWKWNVPRLPWASCFKICLCVCVGVCMIHCNGAVNDDNHHTSSPRKYNTIKYILSSLNQRLYV